MSLPTLPLPGKEETGLSPRSWGSYCPTWPILPSPSPASVFLLGFHGDQEAASRAEEEVVSKATCYCRNWLGLKFAGYQGKGLEERSSCAFLLETTGLPATCPPQGLALMERVVATTTSMPSTENGLNCFSGRRMNSCLRR